MRTSHIRVYWAFLTIAALPLFVTACAPASGFPRSATEDVTRITLAWKEAAATTGATTPDPAGDVLIIGGSVEGPSGAGGQATWTTSAAPRRAAQLSLTIYTNGDRWYGKGIHSTRPGGTVGIYVNDMLVHTIACDRRGAYGDYWPAQSPAGQAVYATGSLDVAGRGIRGPALTLKIVASPYTAVDIHQIEVVAVHDKD